MKNALLILTLTTFSQFSFASMRAGGPVEYGLKCLSRNPSVGSQVGLIVTTAALAPQYNVRGIALTTKAIAPNAKVNKTALNQVEQTAYNATFASKGIKVQLDKGNFQAVLNLGSMEYFCK